MKHSLPSPLSIRTDLRPTLRELRWFAHIDRHGPQSSEFLYEATRATHRCRDTSLRRLQMLREAGYLRLPSQQLQIAKANFNPYVYDLTKLGWDVLSDHQDLERHCRPTGHWWHGYWVAAVSSAIEISITNSGLTYIPAAKILAIKGVEMGIPVSGTKLIPDQLFAIKYPDGYRTFALEVDRGTEPVRTSAARKSLQRSIAQYRHVIETEVYRKHYGLKSKLAVLWVFLNHRRCTSFEKEIERKNSVFLRGVVDAHYPRWDAMNTAVRRIHSLRE